ncbi:hypothetical protein [Stenotrophobium rhamnosiphilum]|uniref:Transmembrane protein n=1 Tax=Stenotrophobium rhamnosiphilum TaxID=2029166 RepID=A0A2T5MKE6_9GAMM|nr:hypothetical protein [Stenotrophobium rhamnosiphilum]PTU33042.1 hypothetical protein CJD38_02740 [Stenotrophobium rhamnosiphilum]
MLPPTNYARRRPVLPILLFSAGLGICMYFGQEWYQLPKYSESDIDASTELNLKLDLQNRGPNLQPTSKDELETMRARVRFEITSSIKAERDKITQRFSIGLVALVLGFGQLVMEWLMRRGKN